MPALLYLRTRTKALGNTHPCACRRARAFVVLFILALVLFVQQHQVRSAWLLARHRHAGWPFAELLRDRSVTARHGAHGLIIFFASGHGQQNIHTHTDTRRPR